MYSFGETNAAAKHTFMRLFPTKNLHQILFSLITILILCLKRICTGFINPQSLSEFFKNDLLEKCFFYPPKFRLIKEAFSF